MARACDYPSIIRAGYSEYSPTSLVRAHLGDLAHPQTDDAAILRFGLVGKRRTRHRHEPQRMPLAYPEVLA